MVSCSVVVVGLVILIVCMLRECVVLRLMLRLLSSMFFCGVVFIVLRVSW